MASVVPRRARTATTRSAGSCSTQHRSTAPARNGRNRVTTRSRTWSSMISSTWISRYRSGSGAATSSVPARCQVAQGRPFSSPGRQRRSGVVRGRNAVQSTSVPSADRLSAATRPSGPTSTQLTLPRRGSSRRTSSGCQTPSSERLTRRIRPSVPMAKKPSPLGCQLGSRSGHGSVNWMPLAASQTASSPARAGARNHRPPGASRNVPGASAPAGWSGTVGDDTGSCSTISASGCPQASNPHRPGTVARNSTPLAVRRASSVTSDGAPAGGAGSVRTATKSGWSPSQRRASRPFARSSCRTRRRSPVARCSSQTSSRAFWPSGAAA